MNDHRKVEAFRAVMQTGTMTGAGKLLRTSQPSVSRLISDLEQKLGLQLFLRRHGRVVPTDAGHRLYGMVEQSFIGVNAIFQFAADMRDFREAQITVAAMPALCLDIVPLSVAHFLRQYPNARVAAHARSSRKVVDSIISHEVDIGLATPPYDLPGLRCEIQVEVPFVCMIHSEHRLAAAEAISPADLRDEPIISLSDATTRRHLEEAFEAAGMVFRPRVETPLSMVAARHVELGVGVAIADPYVAQFCRDRNLVVLPFRPAIPFAFGVICPDGVMESAAAVAFREILIGVLRDTELPRVRTH